MATSSICHQWTYNVFVSFRGEDIRKSFMDHLFKDFRQKGIYAFNDNHHLPRGEEISSKLYKAIEESRFLIVIFSKNYASSSWCLRELVKILECKQSMDREHRHEVRIIFYDVKPDVVRKQTESYAEAFSKHEVLNRTEVAKWKESLSMAANLSGWDLQDMTNGYESKFISSISKELLDKLCDGPLHVGENLVGVDARVNKMNLLCFVESSNVHMIGICGISGIGKTTLARAIYNLLCVHFEECCFFDDVQGATKQHGLTQVIKQLVDDIMKTRDVRISNIGQGIMVLKQRMGSRRMLLVLDGVAHHTQLEALAGSSDWFLPGSLIIFTSQDKQLLRSHKVDEIFDMEFLDDVEALTLFSLYAFNQKHPTKDFGELAYRVVQYVQGHPLALKLLGHFLHDKTMSVWKSELDKLQIYPNMEIQQVLRLTFDGLDFEQQRMLLDIACYLIGENKDLAASILNSCDFFAHTNMKVLLDKSLITISGNMTLQMHELIQRMARGIIREESERPGDRSRLWIQPEVCDVVNKDKVTEAVEVLVLSLKKSSKRVNIDGKSFAHMNNLRILKIHDLECENSKHPFKLKLPKDSKVNLLGGLKFLSNELRMLYWHGYPSKFLPSNFYPENIIVVDMSYSHIKKLWTTRKCFQRLKQMKLRHCHNLTTTPDFTEIRNLEKLILEGCVNLATVHPSIGMLNRLVVLDMRNCTNLKSFPSKIEMNSLEVLNLSGCSKLEKLPIVLGRIKTLIELHVDRTAIKELPLFVFSPSNLQILSIGKYVEIQSRWWTSIFRPSCLLCKLQHPQSLVFHSLASLCLLKHLDVSHSNLSDVSPDIGDLSCLEYLNLSGNNFTSLPASLSELSRLRSLGLNDCNKLEVLPELSPTIKFIYASRCPSLQGLGNQLIMRNNFYQYLFLIGCPKLVKNLKSLMSMLLPQGLNYICGRLDIMFYRQKIPQWFTNRSMGNCVNVELPPGWCYNKLRGYGTCVVFTRKKSHGRSASNGQPRYFVNNFDGTCLDDACMLKFDLSIMDNMVETNGCHVTWLHYSKRKPSWQEAQNLVTFSFRDNDHVEVKECGVRLIWDEDVQEDVDLISMSQYLQTPGPYGGIVHVNHELSSESIEDESPFWEKRIMWSTK